MTTRTILREDRGAVAVLYGVMFAFVILPLLVVGTTSYVRSTTTGELQRAADSGTLAGAASLPLANLQFAIDYVNATSGGAVSLTMGNLGLTTYPYPDPLQVACDRTTQSANDSHNIGSHPDFATNFTCNTPYPPSAEYAPPLFLSDTVSCATGMTTYVPTAAVNLMSLLPALLTPGVQIRPSWKVTGPLDSLLGGSSNRETVTSVARRRFKNMVVVPVATLPVTGTQINLNPLVSNVRTTVDNAITSTESLLSTVGLPGCQALLEDQRGDLDDAVAPPNGGPSADQILATATSDQTPIVVILVVDNLGVPFLDFVPVCVGYVNGSYVGDPTGLGTCTVDAPGAFRASVRSQ